MLPSLLKSAIGALPPGRGRTPRGLAAAAAAAAVLWYPPGAAAQQAAPPSLPPLEAEVGVGYDFFSHSYSILAVDTTSTVSEGSTRLDLRYTPIRRGEQVLGFGDRLYLSGEYLYNVLSASWRDGMGMGWFWDTEARWETKRFGEDGLALNNDHDALLGSLRAGWRGSGLSSVRFRLAGEYFDYDRKSSYFYDTRTLDGTLRFRAGSWTGPFGGIDLGGRRRTVPDSTLLEHTEARLDLTGGWAFDSGGEVELILFGEQRDYDRESARPDRRWTGGRLRGRLDPLGRWGSWLRARYDRRDYSRQTLVYNDDSELRIAAGPAWRPGPSWEIRLGAGMAWHRSETVTDTTYVDLFGVTRLVDSWSQPFLDLEVSLFAEGGGWALLDLEAGDRRYREDTEFDSDYRYVDLTATAEMPLGRGLALQTLVSYTPERHREPEDNSVTNFTSLDLVWRFR
ncbi:MAG: hypothetical protein R6W82_00035 [bacterium]